MSIVRIMAIALTVASVAACTAKQAHAQAFGVELGATLMPVAGGMGGTGIARPQDVQSALALNPAALVQHKGTKFSFSGSWVEPTIKNDHRTSLPLANIDPYQSKSKRPGSIVGNIAVSQDYSVLGLPATVGVGLLTASGLGVNYRDVVASNGTTAELVVLGTGVGTGVLLTERLSVGFTGLVATASMDGVFTGISAATPDYNLRAFLGFNYDLNDDTTVGGYWHTKQKHTFDDFVRFGGPGNAFQDLNISFPNIYGLGIANESLMDGRLLLAADFSFYEWSDADFFGAIWEDQFTAQFGVQFTNRRGIKYRAGYAYAENASRNIVTPNIGGISPQAGVDYIQSLLPNINQHRISGGLGLTDILPGVDIDLFAGGMFGTDQNFGDTTVSAESYWIGFGSTWRFGRGSADCLCIPNQW